MVPWALAISIIPYLPFANSIIPYLRFTSGTCVLGPTHLYYMLEFFEVSYHNLEGHKVSLSPCDPQKHFLQFFIFFQMLTIYR